MAQKLTVHESQYQLRNVEYGQRGFHDLHSLQRFLARKQPFQCIVLVRTMRLYLTLLNENKS